MKTQLTSIPKLFRFMIGSVVLMMISVTSMQAQGNRPDRDFAKASPEDRAKRLTEMMKDSLSLTAAQEPRVATINLKYARKNEELRKIADTTARRKAFQDSNKQKDAELKVVLTPKQFAKYLKQVEEAKSRQREMQR